MATTEDINLGVLARGPQGAKGEQGNVGPAPTLKIGTVTKLGPDQTPTANLSGGNGSYTLNMGIPQGETNATATNALNVANSVDSKVTAIQANGGGRNLAIGTAFKKCGSPNWGADGGQISLDTLKSLRGQWITISCDMSWTGFAKSTKANNRIGYELGLRYSDGTSLYINNWYLPSDSEVNKNFRFGRSWKLPDKDLESLDEGWLYNQIIATTCATSKLMIEKGTVAHDWSPAPEDIQSEIDANKTAAANAQNTANTAKSTADSALSKANSNATALNSKANKSDLTWANISGKPSIPSTFNGSITDTSTDFNNLVTEGHYDIRFSPSSQGKNGPKDGNWGLLDVKVAGRMVVQTYYGDAGANVYVRNRRDGTTWTAWRNVTFWPRS